MDIPYDEPSGSMRSLSVQKRHASLRENSKVRSSSPIAPVRYRAPSTSAIQSPDLRKSASRSTMATEGLWDQSRRRWSAWTTDTDPTEDTSSQLHIEFDAMLKPVPGSAPESSYAAASRSDQGNSARFSIDEDMSQEMMKEDSNEGWHRHRTELGRLCTTGSRSPSPSPPSPTSEAALDAALSSTMLALTTANSLLLSTMGSRRELAKMRALQNEMEHSLNCKEQDLRRKVDENNRTIAWMEQACKRLDDVLQGRQPEKMATDEQELSELAEIVSQQESQRPPLTTYSSSRSAVASSSRSKLVVATSSAAPSMSRAASREHEVRSPGLDRQDADAGGSVNSTAAQRLASVLQSQSRAGTVDRPSKAPDNTAAPEGSKLTESRQMPLRMQASHSLLPSSSTVQAVQSTADDTKSSSTNAKSASALLSATLLSGAGRKGMSAASPMEIEVSADRSASKLEQDEAAAAPISPVPATARSDSLQHRTPSALKVAQDLQGSGSSLTNAAHSWRGDAAGDAEERLRSLGAEGMPNTRRKGALEALRQLNNGSHADAPSALSTSPARAHSERSTGGWAGTVASWIGLHNEAPANKSKAETSKPRQQSITDKDSAQASQAIDDAAESVAKAE